MTCSWTGATNSLELFANLIQEYQITCICDKLHEFLVSPCVPTGWLEHQPSSLPSIPKLHSWQLHLGQSFHAVLQYTSLLHVHRSSNWENMVAAHSRSCIYQLCNADTDFCRSDSRWGGRHSGILLCPVCVHVLVFVHKELYRTKSQLVESGLGRFTVLQHCT